MTRRVPPLVEFRIRPEPGTRYVSVFIWPSYRALQAHRKREGHRPLGGVASCTEWLRWWCSPARTRRSPKVAEVNFHRGRIDAEIVSHEMFHAALAWGRRVRFDWSRLGADDSVNDDEERLAYVHSNLVAEFVKHATPRGLFSATGTR